MNQPEQYPQRYDDEISLVDLATTFVRRRNVFFIVFALVVIAGLSYVFLSEKVSSTNYSTTLRLAKLPALGEDGSEPRTERVPTLLATIDSRWQPQAQVLFQEQGNNWPASTKAESLEGTELIRLATSGANLNAGEVQAAHELLAALIINHQNEQLARRTTMLEEQVVSLNDVIANHSSESVVAAQAIETRARLQQKIATGEPAEVLSLARESAGGESGPSAKLVIALAIILGGMLGIFAAFMAEFVSHVRKAMAENNT